MIAVGGLYVSHGNGKLYAIKPNGTYAQLGDSSGWNTRLMAATFMTRTVWLVEQSGEPGNNQEWSAVASVTSLGNSLFASTPGKLWLFVVQGGERPIDGHERART